MPPRHRAIPNNSSRRNVRDITDWRPVPWLIPRSAASSRRSTATPSGCALTSRPNRRSANVADGPSVGSHAVSTYADPTGNPHRSTDGSRQGLTTTADGSEPSACALIGVAAFRYHAESWDGRSCWLQGRPQRTKGRHRSQKGTCRLRTVIDVGREVANAAEPCRNGPRMRRYSRGSVASPLPRLCQTCSLEPLQRST